MQLWLRKLFLTKQRHHLHEDVGAQSLFHRGGAYVSRWLLHTHSGRTMLQAPDRHVSRSTVTLSLHGSWSLLSALPLVYSIWALAQGADAATFSLAVRNCTEGCTNHGNCNGETGQCECMFGFGGADCSQRLLPACHSTLTGSGSVPFYGALFPKNCQCWRQLEKLACPLPYHNDPFGCWHSVFWFWDRYTCYEYRDVPEEKQLSDPPADARDPRVRWSVGKWNRVRSPCTVCMRHDEEDAEEH